MRGFWFRIVLALSLALGLGLAAAQAADRMPIKGVIVTTFEIGAGAGEFQPWVVGWPLKHEIKILGVRHVARHSDNGVPAIVSDMRGRTRESVAALFNEDGVKAGFDATFRGDGVVVRELVGHWDRYASEIPTATGRSR